MKTLFVSHDCGINYSQFMQSESIDELVKRTEQEDMDMLRWYIKDENGVMDYEHISPIHKSIIAFLKVANSIKGDLP
jgi:hypothetical protein